MKEVFMSGFVRSGLGCLGLALAVVLSGCGSKALTRAPVEDRGATGVSPVTPATVAVTKPVAPVPVVVSDNAGKSGYYTVKPGDTLIRIGLDNGQSHRDLVRWNNIENPNKIEVGQVLRVAPPAVPETAATTKPVTSSSVAAAPIGSIVSAPAKAASSPAVTGQTASTPVASASGDDDLSWIWPSGGAVLAGFDEVKNKGLDLGGAAGDPVLAAADGRVVYAGAGLRGYGNLVILKHNATYLTAYAHNQALMVKEDQAVKKGQKIAEMGNSDADRVKLHFEVRRQGKPVDPAKYLPAR
jgi:lipoprotein NlpD